MIIIDTSTVVTVTHPSREPSTAEIRVELYNMGSRVTDETTLATWSFTNGVIEFDYPFDSKDNANYFMVISDWDGSKTTRQLFTSRVFCTTQTDLQDYEITKGDFTTPPPTNNEFLTY